MLVIHANFARDRLNFPGQTQMGIAKIVYQACGFSKELSQKVTTKAKIHVLTGIHTSKNDDFPHIMLYCFGEMVNQRVRTYHIRAKKNLRDEWEIDVRDQNSIVTRRTGKRRDNLDVTYGAGVEFSMQRLTELFFNHGVVPMASEKVEKGPKQIVPKQNNLAGNSFALLAMGDDNGDDSEGD